MAEKEPRAVQRVEIADYDLIRRLWENRIPEDCAHAHVVIEITIDGQRYEAAWPMVPDNYPTIENRLPPLPKDSCQD